MILPGFVGPSNQSRALSFDNERTINLYHERRDTGTPKSGYALLDCPGIYPRWNLPAGPIRAIFYQDGRAFAIGGPVFVELYPNYTYLVRGLVAVDGFPASISSNGNNGFQLFITSGGYGYVFNTRFNDFEQITDDAFPYPVSMGVFADGYSVALKYNSNQFFLSSLNDSLEWNGLDTAQTSESSDNKITLACNHRELWLQGTKHTEIWVNVGDSGGGFPYQPVPGTLIESGTIAAWGTQLLDNTIFYIGGSERGARVVYRMDGYTPSRVSTFGVEQYLNALTTVSNAICWTYEEGGHAFYLIYLPAAETTLCYDVSTDLWHERSNWDDFLIRDVPHRGRCHAYAASFNGGQHLVGDRENGAIYEMALSYSTDYLVV